VREQKQKPARRPALARDLLGLLHWRGSKNKTRTSSCTGAGAKTKPARAPALCGSKKQNPHELLHSAGAKTKPARAPAVCGSGGSTGIPQSGDSPGGRSKGTTGAKIKIHLISQPAIND